METTPTHPSFSDIASRLNCLMDFLEIRYTSSLQKVWIIPGFPEDQLSDSHTSFKRISELYPNYHILDRFGRNSI